MKFVSRVVSQNSTPSVDPLDVWDVEWSAFLPAWGKCAVPHYKWNTQAASQWGHSGTAPQNKWGTAPQNKWGTQAASQWTHAGAAPQNRWKTHDGAHNADHGVMASVPQYQRNTDATTGWAPSTCNTAESTTKWAPSVGSAGHDQGLCKRCAFFPKGRCKNGENCTHCHLEHPKQVRHRRRTQNKFDRIPQQEHEQPDEDNQEQEQEDEDEQEFDMTFAEYYTTNVLPSCGHGFWNSLHAQFATDVSLEEDLTQISEEKPSAKGDFDFDPSAEAETTCPSGSSDVEISVCSNIEAKFHGASSSDEASVLSSTTDSKSKLQPSFDDVKTRLPWRATRCTSQVEASSTTESDAPASSKPSATDQESQVAVITKSKVSKGLVSSTDSWAAQQQTRRANRSQSQSEVVEVTAEDVGRKARGLLNKLTQERFDSLCSQILALPFHTPDHLAAVVAEIFEKATTQRSFLMLYTELCARLDAHLTQNESSGVGGKIFRKALVTECQACFERNLQKPFDPQLVANLTYEARYEVELKQKTRTLGNMRFIGELLVRKLLAAKVFFFIVNEMLDIGNDAALESLAELLSIVSPVFEQKQNIYSAPLREVFAALKKKSKDTKVSTCIRYRLCDLLDARARGWAARDA